MKADAVEQGQVGADWPGGAARLPHRVPGATITNLDEMPARLLWRVIRENNLSPTLLDRD